MARYSLGSRIVRVGILVCILLLCGAPLHQVGAQVPPDPAAIEQAIVNGLAWLATQQQGDGGWGPIGSCDRIARTGLAVVKLETRARELGKDPLAPDYQYSVNVQAGLNYLMALQIQMPIGVQPAGNPDGDGDGWGIYFRDPACPVHDTYNTSIALMALAASGHPELYGATGQDVVDLIAWGQADNNCGQHRGGWRYMLTNDCDSDNSNSGWVTVALGYAQASPPHGLGLTVPQFVKDELSIWLDVMQDDVNGDADDGGSWYAPGWPWVNVLKTGSLIYELGLVGDSKTSQRVRDAVDYLERHWKDMNPDPGWGFGLPSAHYQAMFAIMKGLEALGIDKLDLDGDGAAEWDWYAEYAQAIVGQQLADGSWPWDYWADNEIATVWALLTLEKSVPKLEIEVPFDVKPGSCPNPIETESRGVLPVAVLGTADFDVTTIDPASVSLVNPSLPPNIAALPLRWSYEDVATPYEPYVGKTGIRDCNALGPDGYLDLTIKFDTQSVVPVLGTVVDGQAVVLQIRGKLKEEFGGTSFVGEDVVRVLLKGK